MKLKKSFKFNTGWLVLAAIAGLAGFGMASENKGATAMAMIPMLGLPVRKQDIDDGNGNQNGGGDFQAKVLSGIGAVKKQYETIETNFNTLDASTKKLGEDFAGDRLVSRGSLRCGRLFRGGRILRPGKDGEHNDSEKQA